MLRPTALSVWKHKRTGNRYKVLMIANSAAKKERQEEYPLTIIYESTEGEVWSRKLSNFLEAFELQYN